MNGESRIAEHGFGARGCNNQPVLVTRNLRFLAAGNSMAHVPQMTLYAFVDRLEIGNRGLAARAPVDDVLATVDQTFVPEMNEILAHGTGETGVQSEPLAGPIDACAFAPDLRLDASAVLFFPLPDAALKFFAAEILAFDAFGGQLALDNHLG